MLEFGTQAQSFMGFPTISFPTIDTRHVETVHARFAVLNVRTPTNMPVEAQKVYDLLNSDLFKNLRVSTFNVQYDLNVICSRMVSALKVVGYELDLEAVQVKHPIEEANVHSILHKRLVDLDADRAIAFTSITSSDWSSGQYFASELGARDVHTVKVKGQVLCTD